MKKWNLVIDVAKCFNCNGCTLACHDEYYGNEFPGYSAEMQKHGHRWIDIRARETGQKSTVHEAREHAEREHLIRALEHSQWNVSGAARALGMERTNLHKRIRARGLSRER